LRLTATAAGGSPTASDTVLVNVAESYDAWAARTLAAFSPAQRARSADPDNDGNANVIECVLGTDPAAPNAGPELIHDNGHLSLRYSVSKLADPAIQIIPQISDALGPWREGPGYLNLTIAENLPVSQTRVAEDINRLGDSAAKFMRLKIVSP
jgi:hypothetical protein